ncbi:MAG: YjbQ family protein [Candidatus Lokiarchaeota archaeon]|nr:YjbQ family protein [Candidatus Lokiarchaeota archaeon]
MDVITRSISFHSRAGEIVDITRQVSDALRDSGLSDGTVTVFVPGATGAVSTIEYEPGLVREDLPRALERIAPVDADYGHDAAWHDGNGYSHVRATLMGPSLAIPFKARRLLLGTWQQVIFVNHDNRSRDREVILQFMGK